MPDCNDALQQFHTEEREDGAVEIYERDQRIAVAYGSDAADRIVRAMLVGGTQALIALGKYAAGYRPGGEGWSPEDQAALDAANGKPTSVAPPSSDARAVDKAVGDALDALAKAFGNDWTPEQGDAMDRVRDTVLAFVRNDTATIGVDPAGGPDRTVYSDGQGNTAERLHDPREDKSPPTQARLPWIVQMMWDLGMYTQAREVQRLGDAYYALRADGGCTKAEGWEVGPYARGLLERIKLHFQRNNPDDARYSALSPNELAELFTSEAVKASNEGDLLYFELCNLLARCNVNDNEAGGKR